MKMNELDMAIYNMMECGYTVEEIASSILDVPAARYVDDQQFSMDEFVEFIGVSAILV